jgi:hypothetical protein
MVKEKAGPRFGSLRMVMALPTLPARPGSAREKCTSDLEPLSYLFDDGIATKSDRQ